MLHQQHEIRVEAPLDDVWAFYCDTSHWPEWLPRGEFTDFTGPVDEIGTTYVVAVRFLGIGSRQPMEIVEVEPLRLVHERNDDWPKDGWRRGHRPTTRCSQAIFELAMLRRRLADWS